MKIEDLYKNELGTCCLFLYNDNEEHRIPMTFHEYARIACKYTFLDVQQFENMQSINLLGRNSIEASCFWFLTIESFVNTILKYLCLDNSEEFSKYIKHTLDKRIRRINEFLEYNPSDFSRIFPQAKLNEFEDFRNEIFHDRYLEKEKTFNKAFFSPIPYLPNFVSEIQALILALDFFTSIGIVLLV